MNSHPKVLSKLAFSGSDTIITSRASTPLPKGNTLSMAVLGPPIAINTVPLSAAGVAPKTGAGIAYQ